jgi:hypothetical protein
MCVYVYIYIYEYIYMGMCVYTLIDAWQFPATTTAHSYLATDSVFGYQNFRRHLSDAVSE